MIKLKELKDDIIPFIRDNGCWDGKGWIAIPRIPDIFKENLDFQSACGCNANFLFLTLDKGFIYLWFEDQERDTFSYLLDEDIIEKFPCLIASIMTYIYLVNEKGV